MMNADMIDPKTLELPPNPKLFGGSGLGKAGQMNAARKEFLSILSHELRTPLNAVMGFAQLLTAPDLTLERESEKEYAQLILESSIRLLGIVEAVLEFAQFQTDQLRLDVKPLRLDRLVESVVKRIRNRALSANVELTVSEMSDLPEVLADKPVTRLLLSILATSAIDAARPGSEVGITAAHCATGEVEIIVSCPGAVSCNGQPLGFDLAKAYAEMQSGGLYIQERVAGGMFMVLTLPTNDFMGYGALTPAKPA